MQEFEHTRQEPLLHQVNIFQFVVECLGNNSVGDPAGIIPELDCYNHTREKIKTLQRKRVNDESVMLEMRRSESDGTSEDGEEGVRYLVSNRLKSWQWLIPNLLTYLSAYISMGTRMSAGSQHSIFWRTW